MRYYNTYTLPIKLARNKYGVTQNTSFINSNSLFQTNSESMISVSDTSSASSMAYIPDFIGADSLHDGVRGLVPAPAAGQQEYFLQANGSWSNIPVFTGRSSVTNGKKGLVPAPLVNDGGKYLNADGTWSEIPIFTPATSTADGEKGIVPAPSMGQIENYILEASGNWEFDAAHKWLKEFPYSDGLEKSGLGIDGDFNVTQTLSTLNLNVEGRMHVWELILDKVKSTNGNIIVSPSNFTIDEIGTGIIYYMNEEPLTSIFQYRPDIKRSLERVGAVGIKCQRVYMKNDDGEKHIVPSVSIGDMLRCRTFNIESEGTYHDFANKDYYTFVLGVGEEQYREIPEGGTLDNAMANFIDLALFILTQDEGIPVGSVIDEDGNVDIPTWFEPEYEIADLKDISRQVQNGQHDRMEEFPSQTEMDQITVAILNISDTEIPSELIDVDDYIFHYTPIIHHESVSGSVSWDSSDYASELDKYNNSQDYADFVFGYGEINISVGDELACLGHLFDLDRRNAIVLSAVTPIDSELKPPAIAQYNGIDTFGLSISRFRLNTIAKNGNSFYGWFGIDSGDGSYVSVSDVISTTVTNAKNDAYSYASTQKDLAYSYTSQSYDLLYSYVVDTYTKSIAYTKQTADSISAYVYDAYAYSLSFINQRADSLSSYVIDSYAYTLSFINQTASSITSTVQDTYNSLYSYITQEAGKISSYVIDSYAYTLSFINQTATSISSSVQDTYNGLYSYITQEADKISTYVVDSYAYSLSFTTQTATSISSTVQDLSTYTYSNIEQLSDRIDLSVSKDELEVVGIHIDGQDSTVNIVGSLAVKQNNDGDVDTIKVYDEDDVLRVEVSPTDIPSKSSIGINEKYFSLRSGGTFNNSTNRVVDLVNRKIKYTVNFNISDTLHENDTISIIQPEISLTLNGSYNNAWGASGWINGWEYAFEVETSDGVDILGPGGFGSGPIPANYISNGGLTLTFKSSATATQTLDSTFEGKSLKVFFYVEISFASDYPTTNIQNAWYLTEYSTRGNLRYVGNSGYSDTSFMEIGDNGFYYSYVGNYLYVGEDGFEFNYTNSRLTIDDDDVKIYHNPRYTQLSYTYIGTTNHYNTYNSIVQVKPTIVSGSVDKPQLVLGNTSVYGLGRELTIVGFYGLSIHLEGDDVIFATKTTSNDVINVSATNGEVIVFGDQLIHVGSIFSIPCNGVMKLLALSDGWHCSGLVFLNV